MRRRLITVFYDTAGHPVTEKILRGGLRQRSGAPDFPMRPARFTSFGTRSIRTSRSHLAMGSAPAKAIPELAGHEDLSTTLRYVHLSPAARESAIVETGARSAQILGK